MRSPSVVAHPDDRLRTPKQFFTSKSSDVIFYLEALAAVSFLGRLTLLGVGKLSEREVGRGVALVLAVSEGEAGGVVADVQLALGESVTHERSEDIIMRGITWIIYYIASSRSQQKNDRP